MPDNQRVVLVVGPIASGKGALLDRLVRDGFTRYSLSETLREHTAQLGLPPNRETWQDLGDLLRKHGGAGKLAELTIEKILRENPGAIATDSVRNPGEIEVFQKYFTVDLYGVDADPETRFKWFLDRQREGDPKTWEEFMEVNNRDLGIGQPENGQQVADCIAMVPETNMIRNDDTLENLEMKVERLLISRGIEGKGPHRELQS